MAIKTHLIEPDPLPAYAELNRRIGARENLIRFPPQLRVEKPLWQRRIDFINERCEEAKTREFV
jgi:hypothetical protein